MRDEGPSLGSMAMVAMLLVLLIVTVWIDGKDIYQLQFRIGALEQQVKRLEEHR